MIRVLVGGVCLLVIISVLGGCTSGARVTSDAPIPRPLIDSISVPMGLHISEELSSFVFEDKIHQHGKFTIELGESQQHMFNQIFGALFSELVPVPSLERPPQGIEGIIVPNIVVANISIPQQAVGDFYEVWIRYSIKIVGADGVEIVDWVVPAYGRANRHNFSNPLERPTQALTKARNNAMRDAATQISLDFMRQPAVQDWMSEKEEA